MANAHPAQDREREFRPDAADVVDEQTKQVAFGGGHEPVENVRVFPDVEMSQDLNGLSGGGQFIVARERNENFVADAAHVDDRLGGQGRSERPVEKGNHLSQPLTLTAIVSRSASNPLAGL